MSKSGRNLTTIIALTALFALLFAPTQAQEALLGGPLLAFNTSAQDRVILYDVASGTSRDLTFGSGWHTVWGFLENGCRVVYTLSDGPVFSRVYSARLDGSDTRQLIQFSELPAADWGVWEPKPSPDGTRVAFTMMRGETKFDGTRAYTWHIGWVDAAGGTPQFYSVTGDEHEPEWSADGQWLAYISYTGRVPGVDIAATAAPTPEGQPVNPAALLHEADIWVVSADGTTKYQLTNFPTGSVRAPRWSPDGDLISFTYSPSPNNDQFWMIAAAPNAIPTQLSYQWSLILDATWFPDSAAILGAARDFHNEPENLLWRVPLVGNADTDATRVWPELPLRYADYPRFSPDGRWLALRSEYTPGLVDMLSGSWTPLEEGAVGNTPPVWSPAGFGGEASCS